MDPSRHVGTCYGASSFVRLGETQGYGRRSGRYVAHGEVKHVYVRALHQLSVEVLAATFDHPPLSADPRSAVAEMDFNTADLSSLIERIETITDPRDPRGVRHGFASTLVLIACATLAGHKSLAAISEYCDSSSQEVLARLGARPSPSTGLRVPSSYATMRRAGMAVDTDEFDLVVNTWAAQQADRRRPTPARPELADCEIELDCAEHETLLRAHGRIDRHRDRSAPVPPTITFPHAKTYIIVERESSTLDDVRVSIENRYYVTDLTAADATIEHLFRLVHRHWSIENSLHWVRDVTFGEDLSQVGTGTRRRPLQGPGAPALLGW